MADSSNKGGRPQKRFTEGEKEAIRNFAILGIPQQKIANILKCSITTLRKHCLPELSVGREVMTGQVFGAMIDSALGGNYHAQNRILTVYGGPEWRDAGDGETQNPGKLEIHLHPSPNAAN